MSAPVTAIGRCQPRRPAKEGDMVLERWCPLLLVGPVASRHLIPADDAVFDLIKAHQTSAKLHCGLALLRITTVCASNRLNIFYEDPIRSHGSRWRRTHDHLKKIFPMIVLAILGNCGEQ